jgi:hypothetical protein
MRSIHGVGDLAIHDTALAEEPFLREPETVKEAADRPFLGSVSASTRFKSSSGERVVKKRG